MGNLRFDACFFLRMAAFSSLIQVGFGGGFLESECSRHYFCMNSLTCCTETWRVCGIHWVVVQVRQVLDDRR